MLATILFAILALPGVASANAHSDPASVQTRGSAAIVSFGDGYSRSTGSRSVRWIQRRLRVLGYAAGPLDGRFGPLTERAVSCFQATNHLQVDGQVGPITSARLRSAPALVRLGTGSTQPHGSHRVRAIQRRLHRLGYAPGPVDGRFGPRTRRAVIAFQADHRLAPDGVIGPQTDGRLRRHPAGSPSTASRGEEREPARPPAMPGLQTRREQPAARRLTPHAPLPHGPPAPAVLLALLAVGLMVFTGSYLRTRARIADVNRAPRPATIADGEERVR